MIAEGEADRPAGDQDPAPHTMAARRKRQKTDISGATTPSCAWMAIQLTPQKMTVAT